MSRTIVEAVFRRDRAVAVAALSALIAAAWWYTLHLAGNGRMHMDPQPWTALDASLALLMWTVMMVGMMMPSATPMLLIYARVARSAVERGRPLAASVGAFAGGYMLAWSAFSVLATAGQWGLQASGWLSPMMRVSELLGGGLLIAAGLFQWTALKQTCLRQCQMPLQFIQRHGGFRPGARAAMALGWRHGLYCVGCCWALMALLFVGGVMNVLWIAGLSILVLAEKLLPVGPWFARVTGAALVGAGLLRMVMDT